jgi:hypothetical protein
LIEKKERIEIIERQLKLVVSRLGIVGYALVGLGLLVIAVTAMHFVHLE